MIRTEGLTKHYGDLVAVEDASLELAPGEILGFVGPNGAGKSTFMKMLLGIAHPTAGNGTVLGRDIRRDSVAIRERVGYMPGDMGFYRGLSGAAFLDFCLSFYPRADRSRGLRLAEQFELPLKRRIKGYSTGMRQKLGLIQALAVQGELLILDEPTRGLDPTTQAQFAELLLAEQKQGRSVLLSSHVLEEIERICHRIVFIDRGRIIPPETIQAIRQRFRNSVRVTLNEGVSADLAAIPGVVSVEARRNGHLLQVDGDVGPVLSALAGLGVDSLEYNRPDLLEVYRSIYLSRGGA